MKKFFAFTLFFIIAFQNVFSQSATEPETESKSEIESEAKSESESESKEEVEKKSFEARDIVITVGDVFLINTVFNSCARIILKEDYAQTAIDTMKENLQSDWCWDKDGFFMNQFGHPYQGSLYYNAGRSNGLNFWQSFLVTAAGSLYWEEFGETTLPAVNDFITTPICGSILGETLHRLYVDVNEIFPPLAWLISPMDAINSMCKGKKAKVSGRIEEFDFFFHGDSEYSNVDFSEQLDSDKRTTLAGGGGFFVQYGNPDAHTTKEVFDLFTGSLDFSSYFYYKIDYCIDGFLYSHALYFDESEGTIGLNLIYEGQKSSLTAFSNAALGVKYNGVTPILDSDLKFRYFVQLDGIFLGTRSLYRMYQNIRDKKDYEDITNPPRSYNFGGGALFKAGFSFGSEKIGRLYGEGEVDFLIPYIYSKLEESEANRHFMAQAKLGYEHKITRHFTIGLNDRIIYKADWFESEPDTTHLLNTAQIYAKIVFER